MNIFYCHIRSLSAYDKDLKCASVTPQWQIVIRAQWSLAGGTTSLTLRRRVTAMNSEPAASS